MFVRANSSSWEAADQSKYKDSIVFIEDTRQIYSNGIYYGSQNNEVFLEKIEFSEEILVLNPNKFYTSNTVLETLDLTLASVSTEVNTYFVEFLCDNTCVILPSNIKWKNNIVPDFTKTAIMTIKIQDDTAYLIDCRPLYSVQYTAAKKVQPNRIDAFGSDIIEITEDKFILNEPATEIKENAFEGNQDLISITIPNTVKCIGSKAFSGCSNLQDMEYKGNSKDWNNIELEEAWNEGTEVKSVESEDGSVYLDSYVTFTAQEDNSSIGLTKLSTRQTLEYSTDTSVWNTFNTSTNIPLNNGDKVYVRGVLNANNTVSNYTQFKMSGKISASGNCNALWNYEDLNAPLKIYCGHSMFNGCTSLTVAPELPATTLANYCYEHMFDGCTSLIIAPKLPATMLVPFCYEFMFTGCTSLTIAPELPATTLADSCYYYMFSGCTSLTTAPKLPAATLAVYCYSDMFRDCSSLTTTPELPAIELASECYQNMFRNCYLLTTAPELPATELASACYRRMFQNCASLNYIKCLATDMSADGCTYYWVQNISSTGTFIKHPDATWSTGINGIPSGWIIEDAVL